MPAYGMVVSTRLPPLVAARFADMCERRKVSRCGMVRELVEKALVTDAFLVAALGPEYGLHGELTVEFQPDDEDDPTKGETDP